MNVRLGWSAEIHGTWTKMDVEFDENDLLLHFVENGASEIPQMTPLEKFKLMYSLAEIFVQLHKMSRFPDIFGNDSGKQELHGLLSSRDKLTQTLLERNLVPF